MTDNEHQTPAPLQSNDGIDELSNNPRAAPHQPSSSQPRRPRKCRFFGTKAGCRLGSKCLFLHDTQAEDSEVSRPADPQAESAASAVRPSNPESGVESLHDNAKQPISHAVVQLASRRVPKPVSKAQVDDPRAFQLGQIRRRYNPIETQNVDATVLDLKIAPSDPDFPFEMEALKCLLTVPAAYPTDRPTIRITNKEMGRGYQLNIEAGFYAIIARRPDGTLLQWLNLLDKELEELLSKEKADTVKIVVNQSKKEQKVPAQVVPDPPRQSAPAIPKPTASRITPSYSATELQNAQSKRDADTRQLEARLGRLPQFVKSTDGLVYTVPIEPRKRGELPSSLQSVKRAKMIVPQLYNLQPCRVELEGVTGPEAEKLHEAFRIRCVANPNLSLIAHLNYLSQNMHTMAIYVTAPEEPRRIDTVKENQLAVPVPSVPVVATGPGEEPRSHIVTIPRPPEWNVNVGDESSDSESSYVSSTDDDENGDDDTEADEPEKPQPEISSSQTGILMSFPHLEMHGIELLEVYSVSMEVKCERCKTQMDIQNIKNNVKADTAALRSESCRKCASVISVEYRMDLMHVNSVRAGYLDLDGATVIDLLPSNFIPTCSQCSTAAPQPGVSSVRGESTMAVCRKCHGKMIFQIPEVKFLRTSAAAVRASKAVPRKKQKERLGLTVGEELPKRGRCRHYSKSMRWFRFSCCSKVFPCDRCHDEESDHPIEHANRMICGFCSREQNYRPEDCGFCHAALTGKKGTGFWEGGKGTRDKTKMSRKDPRKYKRTPGSKVGPGAGGSSAAGKKKA